jgi:hypothetical protein
MVFCSAGFDFQTENCCQVGVSHKLVSAACALHSWLVITSKATYLSACAIDEENKTGEIIPGRWRSEIRVLRDLEKYGGPRTTKLAKKKRDRLKAYFNKEDSVPGNMKRLLEPHVTRTKLYDR